MFNTDSTEIWEKEVRPFVEEVIKTCRTDEVLVSTLENLLNHVDSDIICKRNFSFRLDPIVNVLNAKTYYTGTLRNAYQEEIKTVKELHEKISTLNKIVKHEYSYRPQEEDDTVKRDRLPNQESINLESVYSAAENAKPRL